MSNEHQTPDSSNFNREVKEDFSGFTEVTTKDNSQQPQKIDVSDAVEQARNQQNDEIHIQSQPQIQDEEQPQLPGVPRGMPVGMGNTQRSSNSFWSTLMNRGLVLLAIAAVGVFVWWWWSKNNNTSGPMDLAEAAVEATRKTVVEPIKKALKLPPTL